MSDEFFVYVLAAWAVIEVLFAASLASPLLPVLPLA